MDRSELRKLVLPTILVSVAVSSVFSVAIHFLMAHGNSDVAPMAMPRQWDRASSAGRRDDAELASSPLAAVEDVQAQLDALRARLDARDNVRVPAMPDEATEVAELKARLVSLERGKAEAEFLPSVRSHVEGGESSIDHVLEVRRKKYELTDVQLAELRSLELEFLRRDELLLADWEGGSSPAAFCGAVRDAEAEYQRRFEALLSADQLEKRRSDVRQNGAGYVARYPKR
jgi:hypothetical protein